jgi:hypothetical protein
MAQFYVEIRRKATRTKNKDGGGRWAPPGLKIAHNEHSDRASLVILSGDHVGGYSYRREEGIGIFTHGWSDQTGKQFNIESAAGNFNRLEIDFNNATVRLTKDRAGALDTFLYRDTDRIIITNNPLLIRRDNLEIDYASISQYFCHTYGLFPCQYFYKGIERLAPGACVEVATDFGVQSEVPDSAAREKTDQERLGEDFDNVLMSAANQLENSHVAVDLTGGYDSRLIAATLRKNGVGFDAAVHGENDPEVVFVRKFARSLGVRLHELSINAILANGLKDWDDFHFLSGGYYNLFETVKEGLRTRQRLKFSSSKIGGGLGEILRDKWYVDGRHCSILSMDTCAELLIKRLINSDSARKLCSSEFYKHEILPFVESFETQTKQYAESESELDISQKFVVYMYRHYVQGWLGCLYNYHNTMIPTYAPYIDNSLYWKCLMVDDSFRTRNRGMTRLIKLQSAKFGKYSFISGERCSALQGFNYFFWRLRKIVNSRLHRFRRRVPQKHQYDQAALLRTLDQCDSFRTMVDAKCKALDYILGPRGLRRLVELCKEGSPASADFIFLWKALSLKATLRDTNWIQEDSLCN